MLRNAAFSVAALVFSVLPVAAQEPADTADALVLSHTFSSGSREFVRIFLDAGQVYRAEINVGAVTFTIRPRRSGDESPTVALVRGGTAASGESVYEIYPFKEGEYEIQVLDFPANETGHLRIFRDIRASQRRRGIALGNGGGWTAGLELGAGYHGDYQVSFFEQAAGYDRAGGGFEGCLSLRSLSSRGWACLIGVARHTADNAPSVTWFFVEPRFRLGGGRGVKKFEFGLLVRGGVGFVNESSPPDSFPFGPDPRSKPAFVAPGAYARMWFGRTPGRGASVAIAGHNGFILGSNAESGTSFINLGVSLAYHF